MTIRQSGGLSTSVLALDEFKSFVRDNTLLEGLYVVNSDSQGKHWL